jgi:Ca2+-dependent lipid-binding protein
MRKTTESKILKLVKLSCEGLKSMETFGSNDVYVCVEWNGYKYKTPVHDNAGTATMFHEEVTLTPVDGAFSPVLKVAVYDDNSARKDVLIGKAEFTSFVSVMPLMESSFDILDGKNCRTGAVHVQVAFTPDGKHLRVFRLACSGLASAEAMGKNDVYMVAEWLGALHKTKTISGGGASAEFVEEFLLTSGSSSAFGDRLRVSVYDDNTLRSDYCIGTVEITVAHLLQSCADSQF